jgi:indolepyruvate ferredoxin oxidoreductase
MLPTRTTATTPDPAAYALTDRYEATSGTVVLTGLQAITRVLLDRQRIDAAKGLRTGGVASGYPGSPIGGLDLAMHRAKAILRAHSIRHVPGVNEELAAAIISGTQQPHVGGLRADIEGVFGMWYGKSPGADRCGDVFKHANFLGAHPLGGMLAVVGDDPAAKSSSLPSHSETIFLDAHMPVLVPGSTQELLDYGITAFELSRYCGCWVGMTVLTSVADSVSSVDLDPRRLRLAHPDVVIDGVAWQHQQKLELTATVLIDRERDLLEGRHLAAQAFAAANGLNRIEGASGSAWIGIAAAGKTYLDLRQALSTLGFDDERLRRDGVRLLKLGMTFPLEVAITRAFASGLERILVIEEKRAFIETAMRNVLYGGPDQPLVLGKFDEAGQRLVPVHGELTADKLVPLLVHQLAPRLDVAEPTAPSSRRVPIELQMVSRAAAYCSGCPHNRSTIVPEGAVVGAGVGCHGMSYFDPRLVSNPKLAVVPMGSEGVPWIGLADFSPTEHIFQQLGDGTFTHSGQLAVRACIAAGINITFKILHNGYVAMTGGQDIAGGMTVESMTRMLEAEGVKRIIVCADDPTRFKGTTGLAPGVDVWHRDRVLEAQEVLQRESGVTVMIFDQVCAAEARRLRKSGELELPPRQVVINELVCEGCGDCSTQSNCLSVQPVQTELGRKTQIHQSSCNRDYSCLNGDCPSFVSLVPRKNAKPRAEATKKATSAGDVPAAPPEPTDKAMLGDTPFGIYMIGIGGTGVVTVNQLLATAALLDGRHSVGVDQTGMSQKAGQVSSHLQISASPIDDRTAAVANGEADTYLVFDILSGAADQHLVRAGGSRTTAIVSTSAVPTASIVTSTTTSFPEVARLVDRIDSVTNEQRNRYLDALALAESLLGDQLLANVLLLGVAYQAGVLPLTAQSIERAIELNGVAVDKNITAFRSGRAYVISPTEVQRKVETRLGETTFQASRRARSVAAKLVAATTLPDDVRAICEPRAADLVDYQDRALAARYVAYIEQVSEAERAATGTTDLARAVARGFYKLLAYKDEYEVARLHLKVDIAARASDQLGVLVDVTYHLHPPMLRALGMKKKLEVGSWIRPAFRVLRAMRRVRGTALDVFGYAKLRRIERALPGEYAAAVDSSLARLTVATKDDALVVANAADLVRGYEHIKLANIERFRVVLQSVGAGRS